MTRFSLTLAALVCVGAPAQADDVRPADIQRWEDGIFILQRVVTDALKGGDAAAIEVLVEAMRGTAAELDPEGEWNCRTIKMGGVTVITAYRNFKCTITKTEEGVWSLEKTTGSQRAKGTIRTGGLYTGVGFVGDAPSRTYEETPPDDNTPAGSADQTVPVIGWFEQMDTNRARLMQPDPVLESEFDVLYLTRE
ncbi:MAG: DUF4893 domain-containing protein [Pseudomonadota bacterium]